MYETKSRNDLNAVTAPLVRALKVQNCYPQPQHMSPKRLGQWAGRIARKLGIQNLHYSEV